MSNIAFITGSSSGFGRATAEAFHKAGWSVAATMLADDVDGFLSEWGPETDRLLALPLDVTDSESIEAALTAASARFGGIDLVANIAGVGMFLPFEATTSSDVARVFETNTFGPIELMRRAIPHLRARGGGTIVNLTAGSAVVPEPLMTVYNASKAALDNLSEALRYELATQGIAVRVIEPGFVPTTGFVQKASEAAAERGIPKEYQAYVDQRLASFGAADMPLATAIDVARVIVDAANDSSRRLRYVVGGDQAERMRIWRSSSEAEYDEWGWQQFGPTAD
ncbi:MAG: SDR family oxidoreductase [Nocardioidaceae bacterium]